MIRVSDLVVACGLIALGGVPFQAAAGSGQISQKEKQRLIDDTPATVLFRIRAYKIHDEKAITLCANFADAVRKHDVPVVVDKAQFESSINGAIKDKTIKLNTSPIIRSLMGMPAFITMGDAKTRFSARGQADLVDGRVNFRFMTSVIPFDTDDKTNPFWSDKTDGPFDLKPGQTVAIYNKGQAGKPGFLSIFDAVIQETPSLTIDFHSGK